MKNKHNEFDNVIELVPKLDEEQARRLKDDVENKIQQRKNPIIEDLEDADDVIELDEEGKKMLDKLYESEREKKPEYYAALELLPKLDEEQLRILKNALHKRMSEYENKKDSEDDRD